MTKRPYILSSLYVQVRQKSIVPFYFSNNHVINVMWVENCIHLNDMMYKSYRKYIYGRSKVLKIPMQFVWCGKIEIFRMWHLICVLIFSVIRGYVNANWISFYLWHFKIEKYYNILFTWQFIWDNKLDIQHNYWAINLYNFCIFVAVVQSHTRCSLYLKVMSYIWLWKSFSFDVFQSF